MLASFFEGVKSQDPGEMGKKVYKKCCSAGFMVILATVVPCISWHNLPYIYQYEEVDIPGRLAIHQEGGH
jgi:hypothetical protein